MKYYETSPCPEAIPLILEKGYRFISLFKVKASISCVIYFVQREVELNEKFPTVQTHFISVLMGTMFRVSIRSGKSGLIRISVTLGMVRKNMDIVHSQEKHKD